jgi:tRNA G18 (ribose-2'-O)-methylase SpoU
VGAEGPGLSAAALRLSDARVRIPMSRGTDSLNVATAAALAFYERARLSDDAGRPPPEVETGDQARLAE